MEKEVQVTSNRRKIMNEAQPYTNVRLHHLTTDQMVKILAAFSHITQTIVAMS